MKASAKVESANFSAMRTVGGGIHIYNNAKLESFSAPSLTSVGSHVIVSVVAKMTSLDVGALRRTDGDLQFVQAVGVAHVRVPSLEHVGGSLELNRVPGMRSFTAEVGLLVSHIIYTFENRGRSIDPPVCLKGIQFQKVKEVN